MIAVLIGGGHRERKNDALVHLLSQRSAQYRRVVLRSISRYRDHRARGTRATGVSVGPAERRRVRTTLAGNRAPGEGPSVIRVIHEARSGRLAAEEEIDMISVGIGRAHTEGQGGTNRDRLARRSRQDRRVVLASDRARDDDVKILDDWRDSAGASRDRSMVGARASPPRSQ